MLMKGRLNDDVLYLAMDENRGERNCGYIYIFTWHEEMECELSQFDTIKGAWAPNALNSGAISAIGLSIIEGKSL